MVVLRIVTNNQRIKDENPVNLAANKWQYPFLFFVLMKLFNMFLFYSSCVCFLFVFHSWFFFHFYFRPMRMYIFPSKVKSLSVECIKLYFAPLGLRGADHWFVTCKSIVRMNLSGILCFNVHCASEIWSSGCVLY